MASDRPLTDTRSDPDRPSCEERVAAARAVVYDDNGELIDPEDLDAALEAHGVIAGVNDDGFREYQDVPRELSLSACHLAVDLQRDPAEFIVDPAAV